MNEIRIKLTAAQLTALDTAGAFEPALDEDDEILSAALQEEGYLVTADPNQLSRIVYDLSNAADDYAEHRAGDVCAELRRAYRGDCQVFLRLARKIVTQGVRT